MLWANNAFLAIYGQSNGKHKICFPRPVDVEDAYSGEKIGTGLESLELEMQRWETRLMQISNTPAK